LYESDCSNIPGHIAGFKNFKRELQSGLSDEFFHFPQGQQSEEVLLEFKKSSSLMLLFGICLSRKHRFRMGLCIVLKRIEQGQHHRHQSIEQKCTSILTDMCGQLNGQVADPKSVSFPYTLLKETMLQTIKRIRELCIQAGISEPSLLNFAVTDGQSVVATRYVNSSTDEAASLYFSTGTSFEAASALDGGPAINSKECHGPLEAAQYRMVRPSFRLPPSPAEPQNALNSLLFFTEKVRQERENRLDRFRTFDF
jgi:hypothetical protein